MKLGTVTAGLKCKPTLANPLPDSRGSDAISGGGTGGARRPDLMEDALEEAQAVQKELIEEFYFQQRTKLYETRWMHWMYGQQKASLPSNTNKVNL